jgi:hypothetical protein
MKSEPLTLGLVYANVLVSADVLVQAQVFVYAKVFVYAQVLGVYGYAAVPRGGLWPPTPCMLNLREFK